MVVKNGSRLCGTGASRASTPILQNKAYWEFKLQQSGIWSCGLANPGCDLNKSLGEDQNSWAITHENVMKVNGNIEHKIEEKIQEGDIIVNIKLISFKNNPKPPSDTENLLDSALYFGKCWPEIWGQNRVNFVCQMVVLGYS